MIDSDSFTKIALECEEIWPNYLLPKAIKSCPKSNKSPNPVTLPVREDESERELSNSATQQVGN